MSIPQWCERIQDTWLSRFISESTWGYPVAGALHVLAIALLGGAVLIPHLRVLEFAIRGRRVPVSAMDLLWIRRVGLALAILTGTLLFASGAVRYSVSNAFRIKLVLLILIALNAIAASRGRNRKLNSAIALALWAAVIFASRGIAFF